jgi:hypothetical protein
MQAVKIGLVALAVVGTNSAALAKPYFTNYDVYSYTFYDDAAHTNWVGFGQTRCDGVFDYSGSYYIKRGVNSPYYDVEYAGICTENGLEVAP